MEKLRQQDETAGLRALEEETGQRGKVMDGKVPQGRCA